jgi:signal transduction histidine kinase/ActR/RegA family two-component response regulator
MDRTSISRQRSRIWIFLALGAALGSASAQPNQAQRTWIAAHPVVRYGSDTGWRPIVDEEDGRAVGLIPRYLSLLAVQTGLRFEYVHTDSAADALARFQRGELDILPGVDTVHLPAFGEHAPLLTRTFFSSPLVVIGQANEPLAYGLADLQGKRVAMRTRPGAWIQSSDLPGVEIVPVTSTREALEAVAAGRAQYLIGTDALYPAFVRNQYVGRLGIAGMMNVPPLEMKVAVRPDAPALHAILDEAIGRLTARQTDVLYEEALDQVQYGVPSLAAIAYYRRWEVLVLLTLLTGLATATIVAVKARSRARASERMKARFLATMSHEIRTPINILVGTLETLDRQAMPDEQRRLVETMTMSTDALTDLLDNVLDLTRLEAGKVVLAPVAVDPIGMLQSMQRVMAARADAKGLALRLDTEYLPATWLQLDITRVRQVLSNVIGNAIKFTARGSVLVRARQSTGDGEWLVIDVSDTGIGISAGRQPSLFQPYTQADSSTTRRFGGTGLGLSICRELVQLMGGEIVLHSREGVGSNVTIRLPYLACTEAFPASGKPGGAVGRPSTVLVVDDNPFNVEVLCLQLETLGVVGEAAASGADAIGRMRRDTTIDLILLDCFMPGMDGYQTAEALRRAGVEVPVIAVSAASDAAHQQRCVEAGMNGVLTKPLRIRQLAAVLSLWDVRVSPAGDIDTKEPDTRGLPVDDYLRSDFRRLEAFVHDDDAEGIMFVTHRIRGTAAVSGARDIVVCANAIQALGRGVRPGPDDLARLRDAIESWIACHRVRP